MTNTRSDHTHLALKAAIEAGNAIMEVYENPILSEDKADGSPITLADRRANAIIQDRLKQTGIPVVSEENTIPAYEERKSWGEYWLIDPLDGTKEFISKNGEFTVNIALIREERPILGIVTAPALHTAFFGGKDLPSRIIADTRPLEDQTIPQEEQLFEKAGESLKDRGSPDQETIVVSRSHPDTQTEALINQLAKINPSQQTLAIGSSLKFCKLAAGEANLYPRFTPTFEWDTAAAHAILLAAGGEIFDLYTKKPLQYNKEDLHNPPFVAFARLKDSNRFFAEFAF